MVIHFLIQLCPQLLGCNIAIFSALVRKFLCGFWAVHSVDDLGHVDQVGITAQRIAAARAARAFNEAMLSHFAENLLEVGDGDVLALADSSQGHRSSVLAKPHIDHGCYCKAAFGT